MAEWLPPAQSADAALLPALRLGNARADDLVRNNGIAANAVALHKDHNCRAYVSDQLPSELALAGDAGDCGKKLCR
ncbi:portal domain protein [Escherichia coli DEC11C]|nr:portal domain protein [Escherichia coli DEC11C]